MLPQYTSRKGGPVSDVQHLAAPHSSSTALGILIRCDHTPKPSNPEDGRHCQLSGAVREQKGDFSTKVKCQMTLRSVSGGGYVSFICITTKSFLHSLDILD